MEESKPVETEKKVQQNPVQDPHPNPDTKDSAQAPNGDGSWTSLAVGSEPKSAVPSENQAADSSTNRSPTGSKKSVRWSPELVSESTYTSSAGTSPDGSNPYVASSSSFSFKGTFLYRTVF